MRKVNLKSLRNAVSFLKLKLCSIKLKDSIKAHHVTERNKMWKMPKTELYEV
jgi:hypothetical protein